MPYNMQVNFKIIFMFQKLYMFDFLLIFWIGFSFSFLNYVNRWENCQQLGSDCDDRVVFCGANSYSKLHSQLDFNVNSSTTQPNYHRYKWAHKEGGACRLPIWLFHLWILDQVDEIWRVQLVNYNSTEELDELFSKGGIAAAFDEIPYMKIFLAKYCSKYTAVGPIYKFDGFGFVRTLS